MPERVKLTTRTLHPFQVPVDFKEAQASSEVIEALGQLRSMTILAENYGQAEQQVQVLLKQLGVRDA